MCVSVFVNILFVFAISVCLFVFSVRLCEILKYIVYCAHRYGYKCDDVDINGTLRCHYYSIIAISV